MRETFEETGVRTGNFLVTIATGFQDVATYLNLNDFYSR